jgi:hypothetical protein
MPNADPFKFSVDKELVGRTDIAFNLQATRDPAVLLALTKNKPLKPGAPVIFTDADFQVDGGQDVEVGSGTGSVTFKATAGAKLGLFALPAEVRDSIVDGGDLAESIEAALSFDSGSSQPFFLFRWGYDLDATASGAIALGAAGKLTFSANARRTGLFAVVRQMPAGTGVRDAIGSLLGSARLPRQIRTTDDMPPSTWIVAETDSSLKFRTNVKFGQDLSWIRRTSLGTLTGEIGTKVALGVSAGLGFTNTNKYAVLLSRASSREADKKIRLRVFKLKMNESNATFGAKATITPVFTLPPDSFDDFIRGVTGTHSTQIMAALGRFDDWTDPSKPIFGPFLELGAEEARKLLGQITAVADVVAKFEQAKGVVRNLFEAWQDLPADVTRRVMDFLDRKTPLDEVRAVLVQFRDLDQDEVRAVIAKILKDNAFHRSEAGQLLEKLAVDGLFEVLNNDLRLEELQKRAGKLLRLLDGAALEKALKRVHALVTERLHLDQIERAVEAADLNRLDAWLRARLERFLEEKLVGPQGMKRLTELRASLRKVRDTLPELYEKARGVLERDYTFSVTAALSRATTSTALIDVEFDFAQQRPEVAEALRTALEGRFDAFLDDDVPGVTVHEAVLTHGIKRESSIQVVLPFFDHKKMHTNEALARLSRVSQSGGSLFYHMEATDLVSVKNSHVAGLTVSMQLVRQKGQSVDVHVNSVDSASYRQTLDQLFFRANTEDLFLQSRSFVEPLFSTDVGTGGYRGWLNDEFGAGSTLGHALTSLEVTLPPAACLAWLKSPASKDDLRYQHLSVVLQRRFKQLIADVHLSDIARYREVSIGSLTFAVLVFSSLPSAVAARVAPNGRLEMSPGSFDAPGDLHWDIQDRDLRAAMIRDRSTVEGVLAKMAVARARLQAAGDPDRKLEFYKESQIDKVFSGMVQNPRLQSLLFSQLNIVEHVVSAALAARTFQDNRNATTAARAMKALTDFGSLLTRAFSSDLEATLVDEALVPLGALMFAESAKVLDPSLEAEVSAMFTVIDVRDDATFPPKGFPGSDVKDSDILHPATLIREPRRS